MCTRGCSEGVRCSRIFAERKHQPSRMQAGETRGIGTQQQLEDDQRGSPIPREQAVAARIAHLATKDGARSGQVTGRFRDRWHVPVKVYLWCDHGLHRPSRELKPQSPERCTGRILDSGPGHVVGNVGWH